MNRRHILALLGFAPFAGEATAARNTPSTLSHSSILESSQNILGVDGFAIIGHRNGKEWAFYVRERSQLQDREFMDAMLDKMAFCFDLSRAT